jgi:hypothetical protein
VALQQGFAPGERWYHDGGIRETAFGYYQVFRQVLRDSPGSRSAVKRCRECGVFFFAHRSNWGKSALLCPFGCGKWHRQQASNERSKAYYGTPEGKAKKRALNARRRNRSERAEPDEGPRPRIVSYLRFILSFLDGRPVATAEADHVFRLIVAQLRQHGLPTYAMTSKVPDS